MSRLLGPLFLIAFALLSTACVSVKVDPLVPATFEPRSGKEPVETLKREPDESHIEIARIIATSEHVSEDTLREKILSRAKELGADAVILGQADVRHFYGQGPTFQSTAGPAGTTTSPFSGGGYWNPFRMDAWTFMQGAGGGESWMLHLSGVAIRYVSEEERRALEQERQAAQRQPPPSAR
ncbi:MAG TPA: hypothetical protein VFG71_11210 [Nitrospiraceae bacterium]|nr:hypothetical protein [Nitrospiraceae bacterium]